MRAQVTVEEALALVMEACSPKAPQETPTAMAVDRPLCADGVARWDLPPFDRAAVEGYAVRASDLHRANHKRPAFLTVVDAVAAGATAPVPVGPGQAVRLSAGAPLPAGCDCVVPLVDTDGGAETVAVLCQLWPFENIQRQGELAAAGEVLCPAGATLDAGLSSLLRAAGTPAVQVRPMAQIGVLTVGDDLVPAGSAFLPPAKVPDFTQLYLAECWADKVDGTLSQWRPERLEEVMAGCKELLPTGISILLIAGGGRTVREALLQLGADPLFDGLKLRGAETTAAFRYRQVLILALPRAPFAAAVTARLLVPAVLAVLGEDAALLPRRKKLRLLNTVEQTRPERRLLPAKLQKGGLLLLDPDRESLRALAGLEALADLPAEAKPLPGETVTALLL